MKQSLSAESEQQRRPSNHATNDISHANGQKSFVDNRPQAAAQRQLIETINASPKMIAQSQVVDSFHNSPQMVAQRKLHNQMRSQTLQLQVEPEEAPLQGKSDPVQRQSEPEEELLQGKFEPVQRQKPEDEELLQGKFAAVQRVEEEALLQSKFAAEPAAQPAQQKNTLKPNNTGLPDNLKSGIENLSGMSMDTVKVHYNSSQPAQLNAHAYARGMDIHVAPGQEQHLPHEAWHVVQQAQGRVRPTMQMKDGVSVNDDSGLETEADLMGARVISSGMVQAKQESGGSIESDPVDAIDNSTVIQYAEDKTVKPAFEEKFGSNKLFEYKEFKDWFLMRDDLFSWSAINDQYVIAHFQNYKDYKTFGAEINYEQKEQITALSKGIINRSRIALENQLAAYALSNYDNTVEQFEKYYSKLKNSELTTKRDQTNIFDINIKKTNKMFGGSIKNTKKKKIKSGLTEEPDFTSEGLQHDSHYAEASRTAGNYVSSGTDSSIETIVNKLLEKNKKLTINNVWIPLFGIMHSKERKTLYETLFSIKALLPLKYKGIYIYRMIPEDVMQDLKWEAYPDYFESPEFLSALSTNLYDTQEQKKQEKKFPEEISKIIKEMYPALNKPEKKIKNETLNATEFKINFVLNSIPKVLSDELSEEQRKEIESVKDEKSYQELINKYYSKENVVVYTAAMIAWSGTYEPKRAVWYEGLKKVLTPPEERSSKLDAPSVKKNQKTTLKSNVKDIAEFLGAYDYGTSVEKKKEDTDKLIEKDPEGAHKISKYISGNFGKFSDTLDAPWNVEDDDEAVLSLQGAVRGLEGLPVYEGWVYRLEGAQNKHAVGELISPGVLWSSALSPKFAGQFDRGGTGTLYMVKSNFTGRDVQLLAGTTKWYQREVLFPPYARFVVENAEIPGKQLIYTLKEIAPSRKSLDLEDLSEFFPMRQAQETKELMTFIDKRHYDKAVKKYDEQETWTSEESHKEGIEGLGSGIHHPRELYGKQNFRRWQELLRNKIKREDLKSFWSLEGFMEMVKELTGKDQEIRDAWTGWGDNEERYKLSNEKADALVEKGLRVGNDFSLDKLEKQWKKNLNSMMDVSLLSGDYKKVDKKTWMKEKEKESKQNYIWAWRQDISIIENANVLKTKDPREYAVTYGLGKKEDIENALSDLLSEYWGKLSTLEEEVDILPGEYDEDVTKLAANLQQDIVAIHPFWDGNGRISRLYMYKVLQLYLRNEKNTLETLPVIDDTGADLTSSKKDWGEMLWKKVSN